MARQPVPAALPRSQRPVLLQGQAGGIDVGPARAAVEVVPDAVMLGMLAAPAGIRRQRHQAADQAEHVVGPARAEEGPVPAIVLDDEDPNDEEGRQGRRQQRKPDRDVGQQVHRRTQDKETAQRGDDLQDAAHAAWLFELLEDVAEMARMLGAAGRCGIGGNHQDMAIQSAAGKAAVRCRMARRRFGSPRVHCLYGDAAGAFHAVRFAAAAAVAHGAAADSPARLPPCGKNLPSTPLWL